MLQQRCTAGGPACSTQAGGRKAALLLAPAACQSSLLQRASGHGALHLRPFTAGIPSPSRCSSNRYHLSSRTRGVSVQAVDQEPSSTKNTEFGYSRKDVLIICAGLIGLGYAMYYGLQAMGMEAGYAGNWVQLTIFIGICVFWVSTYVYRVATKQMTYAKQLEQYEDAVIRKRLEELTDAELQQMLTDVDKDKEKKQ